MKTIAFATVLALCLMSSGSSAVADPDLTLGTTATVSLSILSCYRRSTDLDAAMTALAASDKQGYVEATRGKALFLRAGQQVRVVDQGGFMGAADRRLRIESGPGKGQACWVSADDVQYFKNIHEGK